MKLLPVSPVTWVSDTAIYDPSAFSQDLFFFILTLESCTLALSHA